MTDNRSIKYDFEGGGSVEITISGDVDTRVALDTIEGLLKLKQSEIKEETKTSNAEIHQEEPGERSDAA